MKSWRVELTAWKHADDVRFKEPHRHVATTNSPAVACRRALREWRQLHRGERAERFKFVVSLVSLGAGPAPTSAPKPRRRLRRKRSFFKA